MTIYGNGMAVDQTFKLDSNLKTTTSQFMCVALGNTTTNTGNVVSLCGVTSSLIDATAAAFQCVGVLQSYCSSGSDYGTVRLFGVSKVVCAETIIVGSPVMAYWGVSTTTMAGRVVNVDNGVTITAYGSTVSSQTVIIGKALEAGVTGSVIRVFVNPQVYDMALVGSIGIT